MDDLGERLRRNATEAIHGGCRVDPFIIEGTANDIRCRAAAIEDDGQVDLYTIAEAAGLSVVIRELHDDLPGFTSSGLVFVHEDADPSVQFVTGCHECAHTAKMDAAQTHGDVWALTLAILMPMALIRTNPAPWAIASAAGVPAWAVSLRLQFACVFAQLQQSAG